MKSMYVRALLGSTLCVLAWVPTARGQTEIHPPMLLPDQASRPPMVKPPPTVTPPPATPVSATPPPAVAVPVGAPAAPVALTQARIQFATNSYDFGKAQAGQLVRYDYVFTNVGTEVLEITDVRTSCGCTTAGNYQRKVEPGKTGTIPIQFNGANFNGPVHKEITVTCNASNQPQVRLELKGTVWRAIEVTPTYVYFNVMPEAPTNETRVVRIVNNLDGPLTLSSPEVSHAAFAAELKTLRPDKEFELHVRVLEVTNAGTVQGSITIKTSATNMPVISVAAVAAVQQLITVIPSQIMLPAAPLASATRMGVTLRNNGQAPIRVFDAAFPVQGVETQIQEVQTGRVFNVMLSFPQGFELPVGPRPELTLKTSHPRYPEVKVPAHQAPKSGLSQSVNLVPNAAPKPPLQAIPASVYFSPIPEGVTSTSRVVRIVNNREAAVTLSEPESSHPAFGAELKTVQAGKEFELAVKILKPLPLGATQGRITLKTSSTETPQLIVPVVAVVQQSVAAIPSQLMLPPAPAASGSRVGITIRNNSPGPITVSDPAINLDGLQPQVQELQTGRIFRVMVSVPPGFELPAGQKGELSVKTSHPQYPTLKVPVMQMAKPGQPNLGPPRAAAPMPIQTGPFTNTSIPRVAAPAPPPPPAPASSSQK